MSDRGHGEVSDPAGSRGQEDGGVFIRGPPPYLRKTPKFFRFSIMRSPLSNISFCPLDFGNKWFVEGNDFEAPMYWLCEIKGLECFYSARSWNSLGLWYLVTHNFLPKWMNLFSIKPGNTIPRGRAGKIALTDITTGLSPWSTYSNAFGGLWGPNEVFNRKKKTCGRILVPAVWPRGKYWVCLLFIHGWLVILQARLVT